MLDIRQTLPDLTGICNEYKERLSTFYTPKVQTTPDEKLHFLIDTIDLMSVNRQPLCFHGPNGYETYTRTINTRQGVPFHGHFGIVLNPVEDINQGQTTRSYSKYIARCGVTVKADQFSNIYFNIEHTPQGKHILMSTSEEKKYLKENHAFRTDMLTDILALALGLGLKKVCALCTQNHPKYFLYHDITYERGLKIIDEPLLDAGFQRSTYGDFCFEL